MLVSEFMKGVNTPTNFSFERIDLSTGDLTSASVTHTDQKEHDWNLLSVFGKSIKTTSVVLAMELLRRLD
ncbi:hypothetical protein P692DRAFT_20840082 [Suillus brevipes Sb2]|nr:hypothetical protein P692DRAFT_20840082 [Suillus brevipes Sb2]